MINIQLYRNTAERNSMRPALNPVGGNIEGVLRDSSSLINVTIIFEKNPQNIYKSNYMYIEELERYYHIDNVTAYRTGLIEVQCTLDVLYTYYDQIINCPGLISRTESVSANRYLEDNKFSYPVIPAMIRKVFSTTPTDTTLVLMVTAGASAEPTP